MRKIKNNQVLWSECVCAFSKLNIFYTKKKHVLIFIIKKKEKLMYLWISIYEMWMKMEKLYISVMKINEKCYIKNYAFNTIFINIIIKFLNLD